MRSTVETTGLPSSRSAAINWLVLIIGIYGILLSVGVIGAGFKWASGGPEGAQELFSFATNPFLALLIGILATALVQSSSTVTTVIVGLVAGGLPVESAIPMVMGANIGTTITNTLVSLGHVREKEEFRAAFTAATVHDFFNLICVVIFLPLELMFNILEKSSKWLSGFVTDESMSIAGANVIKMATKPVINEIQEILGYLPNMAGAITMIVLGVIAIFIAITVIGKFLRRLMVGRAKRILHSAIGRGPISGIASGTLVTVLVQSSSTTTSLAVPLVGSGVFTPRDIYPFTLGANIGTTITALLAATAVVGDAGVAMQIAIVHLLYNVLGVVFVYGIPFLRELPMIAATKLADVATKRHSLAALYVFAVFFFVPGICVFAVSGIS